MVGRSYWMVMVVKDGCGIGLGCLWDNMEWLVNGMVWYG